MKINILTATSGGPYHWGKNLAIELTRQGMRTKHLHELGALLSSPFFQASDIIHTTVPISHRLWKIPVVLTIHGEYTREQNIWRVFYPSAIKKADIITTPSNFLKERLKLDNAIVIPNAVFPNHFRIIEHKDKDTFTIVTVTSFYFREKAIGVLNITKILERLPVETRKRIKYRVVGDGPHRTQIIRETRESGINIEFTGALSGIDGVLEDADLFLNCSYHDNFPIVILEAMACGLPVLTNEVGAVSEIISNERDGYIAPNDDIYLEYLLKLINNVDLRAKAGKNGRETIEANFNLGKVVNRYVEIYKCLSGKI